MDINDPELWNAETPNLYELKVSAYLDDQLMHTRHEKIGFREISVKGGIFRINGQAVTLKGACRHDAYPDVGRATTPEDWYEDIRGMKSANMNTVRTSHYPPAAGFIEACDSMGMYVLDEVPIGYGDELMHDPSFQGAALLRAYETINRDRDRPSVIIWDIGNEDPVTSMHIDLARAIKGWDPTRPVLMPAQTSNGLPKEIDLLAPHYMSAKEYDSLGAVANRPYITTEFNHALGDQDFGGLEARWNAIMAHPTGVGGTIWHWEDQGLKRPVNGRKMLDMIKDQGKYQTRGSELIFHSWAARDTIYDTHGDRGDDGIVNPDRSPQRDYWEAKAVFSPVKVLENQVEYLNGMQTVDITIRNLYDFLNLNSLKIQWAVMHGESQVDAGNARVFALPHDASLLSIPLQSLKNAGGKADYVVLKFLDKTGFNVCTKHVRLVNNYKTVNAQGMALPKPGREVALKASNTNSGLEVVSGDMHVMFNSRTAAVQVLKNGEEVIGSMRPVIWRPYSISEADTYQKVYKRQVSDFDLNKYASTVESWKVTGEKDLPIINATVEYVVDADHKFSVDYQYSFDRSGAFYLHYQFHIPFSIPWLPEAGMEAQLSDHISKIKWTGLGPY